MVNKGKFIQYKDFIVANTGISGLAPGVYYIMVTAVWCAPCQKLKAELQTILFPKGRDLVLIDYDADTSARIDFLNGTDKTIPKLFKIVVNKEGISTRILWRNNILLKDFCND